MAYKTCPECGSRIYEYGCVNCNEQDYIDMQDEYEPPPKVKVKGRDESGESTKIQTT